MTLYIIISRPYKVTGWLTFIIIITYNVFSSVYFCYYSAKSLHTTAIKITITPYSPPHYDNKMYFFLNCGNITWVSLFKKKSICIRGGSWVAYNDGGCRWLPEQKICILTSSRLLSIFFSERIMNYKWFCIM